MHLITLFVSCLLPITAPGQMDMEFPDPFEANEESMLEDSQFLSNDKTRRFMEGLIFEAGKHVIFPELYAEEEEEVSRNSEGIKYYEMKGQPEVEESYMNRESRIDKDECADDCNVYKPVCGTDGKVYNSECHLIKENCGNNNVSVSVDWSRCRGNHYLCPTRCLDLNEPVCGSDLKIYHNICLMRKRNCGKLLQKLPLSVCYEKFSQIDERRECPEVCPPIGRPACGSNGVIYFNECFLKMKTCNLGVVEVGMDSCLFIPKCPEVCLPFYDPVCGSDGQLYTNYCRMLQTNCGKEIKKMPENFCQGS